MSKPKAKMSDVEGFHDAKKPRIKTTEEIAVDTVNPGAPDTTPPSGAQHREEVGVEDDHQVQYQLDPQMVQQAMQNRNARLIAMMVNENAMMEVALDQERAANAELRAKMRAMQEAFGVTTGTGPQDGDTA